MKLIESRMADLGKGSIVDHFKEVVSRLTPAEIDQVLGEEKPASPLYVYFQGIKDGSITNQTHKE